jgi:hypothetical protein
MVHTRPAHRHPLHLIICLKRHPNLYPSTKEVVSSICSEEVTACFASVSVGNSPAAKFFLSPPPPPHPPTPKDMKIAGRRIWTMRRVVHNLPNTVRPPAPAAVLSMGPSDFVFFAVDWTVSYTIVSQCEFQSLLTQNSSSLFFIFRQTLLLVDLGQIWATQQLHEQPTHGNSSQQQQLRTV